MSTLTHPLQHIFEKIMTDALEDHEGTVSIGGRTITNLRFNDDIGGLAGEEEEVANLVERLDKASAVYGMEISAEKTKLMTTEIKVNGQRLETVTSFTYLGSVITDEGSKPKDRQASEQEGVPQSRSSTYAFSVRNISSTSKTSTMSS